VRWTGTVVAVSEFGGSYTVTMKCGSTALYADTRFDTDRKTAASLNKGQTVTVEGTLADHSAFGYELSHVRVIR